MMKASHWTWGRDEYIILSAATHDHSAGFPGDGNLADRGASSVYNLSQIWMAGQRIARGGSHFWGFRGTEEAGASDHAGTDPWRAHCQYLMA